MTDARSRAFSFVDRITSCQGAGRVEGAYTLPAGLARFPGSLVAEAVGQLAAWAAMQAVGFRFRPVAGLAGRIEMLGAVGPGETVNLQAEIESVDDETVVYHGAAWCGAATVLRLQDCVGPMVAMEDFDDPEAVRARFELLGCSGAAPGSQGSMPDVRPERFGGARGESARGRLRVPAAAPVFADHFPRRPVFPGTLLMHANLLLAGELAGEIPGPRPGTRWALRALEGVKLRAFTPPGEELEIEVTEASRTSEGLDLNLATRKGGRIVASALARFGAEETA